MNRSFLIVLTCALSMFVGAAASAQESKPRSLKELAQARVQAAEEVLKVFDKREEGGEALTPTFLGLRSEWQNRLLEARLAAAETDAQRIAAIEDQMNRIRERIEWAKRVRDADPRLIIRMSEYDLADAEYRLAQIKMPK